MADEDEDAPGGRSRIREQVEELSAALFMQAGDTGTGGRAGIRSLIKGALHSLSEAERDRCPSRQEIVGVLEDMFGITSIAELCRALLPADTLGQAANSSSSAPVFRNDRGESVNLRRALLDVTTVRFVKKLEALLRQLVVAARMAVDVHAKMERTRAQKESQHASEVLEAVEQVACERAAADSARASAAADHAARRLQRSEERARKLSQRLQREASSDSDGEEGGGGSGRGAGGGGSSSIKADGDGGGVEVFDVGDDGSMAAAMAADAATLRAREARLADERECKRLNKWLRIAGKADKTVGQIVSSLRMAGRVDAVTVDEFGAFRDYCDYLDAPLESELGSEVYVPMFTGWVRSAECERFLREWHAKLGNQLQLLQRMDAQAGGAEVAGSAADGGLEAKSEPAAAERVAAMATVRDESRYLERRLTEHAATRKVVESVWERTKHLLTPAADDGDDGENEEEAAVAEANRLERRGFNSLLRSKGRPELSAESWVDFKLWLYVQDEHPPAATPEEKEGQIRKAMGVDVDTLCALRRLKGLAAFDEWSEQTGVLTRHTASKALEGVRDSLAQQSQYAVRVLSAADGSVTVECQPIRKSTDIKETPYARMRAQTAVEATLLDAPLGVGQIDFRWV